MVCRQTLRLERIDIGGIAPGPAGKPPTFFEGTKNNYWGDSCLRYHAHRKMICFSNGFNLTKFVRFFDRVTKKQNNGGSCLVPRFCVLVLSFSPWLLWQCTLMPVFCWDVCRTGSVRRSVFSTGTRCWPTSPGCLLRGCSCTVESPSPSSTSTRRLRHTTSSAGVSSGK